LDTLIVFEFAQVRIAGDDEIRFGSERTGQHGIIDGIVLDVCSEPRGQVFPIA
jgi:hypothetical protein